MVTATPVHDLPIEKLRQQELEGARIIQGSMLPEQPLYKYNFIISHEFQPVTEVGGDYLDYFTLPRPNHRPLSRRRRRQGSPRRGLRRARRRQPLRHPLSSHGNPVRGFLSVFGRNGDFQCRHAWSDTSSGPGLLPSSACGSPSGPFPRYDEFFLQLQPGDSVLCLLRWTDRSLPRPRAGVWSCWHRERCRSHSEESPLDLLGHVLTAIEEFTQQGRQSNDRTATIFPYSLSESALQLLKGQLSFCFCLTLLHFSRNYKG